MTNRNKKEDICSCSFDVFVGGGELRVFCHLNPTFQTLFLSYDATKFKDILFFFFLNIKVAAKKLKMPGRIFFIVLWSWRNQHLNTRPIKNE